VYSPSFRPAAETGDKLCFAGRYQHSDDTDNAGCRCVKRICHRRRTVRFERRRGWKLADRSRPVGVTCSVDQIEAGDVLMVTRLDRLARSTRGLLNTLATIADRKAGFRSLGDAWADTTSAHGRLMLTVLGGLAEFERELIRTRTGEGRPRARGVRMGRPPKMTPHQIKEALHRRDAGEPMRDIARTYNVSHSTISRLCMSPQAARPRALFQPRSIIKSQNQLELSRHLGLSPIALEKLREDVMRVIPIT
jgi:DNA invertase Pin-like site-specific DNA recombinase